MSLVYPFTAEDAQRAYDEWGCNCGPTSLAFILQKPLDYVRDAIPGFKEKRYTSPTMMKSALASLCRTFTAGRPTKDAMFTTKPALVRVQWCGPWTKPGANPKWAYRQTHWIVAWHQDEITPGPEPWPFRRGVGDWVFDCNGGIRAYQSWLTEIVPVIVADYPRADGEWFPTHVWRLS